MHSLVREMGIIFQETVQSEHPNDLKWFEEFFMRAVGLSRFDGYFASRNGGNFSGGSPMFQMLIPCIALPGATMRKSFNKSPAQMHSGISLSSSALDTAAQTRTGSHESRNLFLILVHRGW